MKIFKFIGTDGSMGLKNGKVYTICGLHLDKDQSITISILTDDRMLTIPYSNLEKLRENWEIIKKGE